MTPPAITTARMCFACSSTHRGDPPSLRVADPRRAVAVPVMEEEGRERQSHPRPLGFKLDRDRRQSAWCSTMRCWCSSPPLPFDLTGIRIGVALWARGTVMVSSPLAKEALISSARTSEGKLI